MTEHPPKFPFADTDSRTERREKLEKVYNTLEALGLPSRPEMRQEEITGNEAVESDTSPIARDGCPNVIIGLPHAGEYAPESLKDRLTEEGTETLALTDLGTPEIFKSKTIPWVKFGISRFVVDPNRAPEFDLDKKYEKGKAPGTILWTKGAKFGPMYKEDMQPTAEEAENWAERYYLPYYNTVMGAVGAMADKRQNRKEERILLVDGHSFPVTADTKTWYDHYGIPDPEMMPMFILGTRDGEGCDDDIIEAFEKALKTNYESLPEDEKKLISEDIKGELFIRNYYMKGVHNVKFWGGAGRNMGVNALQIECNERAYMDRPKSGDWKDFSYNEQKMAIMHSLIEKTCLDIDQLLKGQTKQ
ncbi:MAG: N-formylglutamate amidohydrolase [Candidatus Paceibacterota bacterium]|jgi:N-formylglutamate amidohydrolase